MLTESPAPAIIAGVHDARRTYSTAEAARVLEVAERTVRLNWEALGGYRVVNQYRFPRAAIDGIALQARGPQVATAASQADAAAKAEADRAALWAWAAAANELLDAVAEAVGRLCVEAHGVSPVGRRLKYGIEGLRARVQAQREGVA